MTAMLPLCFVLVLMPVPYALSETTQLIQQCTSCGPECESSCGSRNFRTCCYNYLKKRSAPPSLPLRSSGSSSASQQASLASGPSFPWLTTLLESSGSRNSPALIGPGPGPDRERDRDLQVQMILLPDWPAPDRLTAMPIGTDALNRYRELNSNYQESPIARLVGQPDPQASEGPNASGASGASGPNESAETSSSSEGGTGGTGTGADTSERGRDRGRERARGQARRHKPSNWNTRNQRLNENFPWSELNRHLPVYGA